MKTDQIAIPREEFDKMETIESCFAAVDLENIRIKAPKGYVVVNLIREEPERIPGEFYYN